MMTQAAPIPCTPAPLQAKEPSPTCATEQSVLEHHILEDLTSVDRLLITKRLRVKSVLLLRGKKNKFFIRTPDQNLVFTVHEENVWWVGYLFYGLRPLQLRVTNCLGVEVMRIHRPFAFTARVLPCYLQHLKVFAPPGNLIGTIEQQWAAVRPLYLVKRGDVEVFWIRGPRITLSCYHDVKFQVVRPEGAPVGNTCKRWQGLLHAMFLAPITDRFGVAFDQDLSVEEKALLLAATLLIQYMHYDI